MQPSDVTDAMVTALHEQYDYAGRIGVPTKVAARNAIAAAINASKPLTAWPRMRGNRGCRMTRRAESEPDPVARQHRSISHALREHQMRWRKKSAAARNFFGRGKYPPDFPCLDPCVIQVQVEDLSTPADRDARMLRSRITVRRT